MTATYEVRLRGRLSPTLISQFEASGLEAETGPVEGEPAATRLHGPVVDQAALHGLLRRIEALGLELVELRRIDPGPTDPGPTDPTDPTGPTGPSDSTDPSDPARVDR